MKALTFRVPRDVYEVAKVAAARRQRSLNHWIVQACRERIKRQARRDKALAAIVGEMKP